MTEPGNSTCARCGATFSCGAKSGAGKCWCAALPPVKIEDPAMDCLCPACLALQAAAAPTNRTPD